MSEAISDQQRQIMIHALTGGTGRPYRNHFVSGPGDTDYDACMELVDKGLMTIFSAGTLLRPEEKIFLCTDKGREAVGLVREIPEAGRR